MSPESSLGAFSVALARFLVRKLVFNDRLPNQPSSSLDFFSGEKLQLRFERVSHSRPFAYGLLRSLSELW